MHAEFTQGSNALTVCFSGMTLTLGSGDVLTLTAAGFSLTSAPVLTDSAPPTAPPAVAPAPASPPVAPPSAVLVQ